MQFLDTTKSWNWGRKTLAKRKFAGWPSHKCRKLLRASLSLGLSAYLLAADGLITSWFNLSQFHAIHFTVFSFKNLRKFVLWRNSPNYLSSSTQNSLKTFLAISFHVFSLAHNNAVIFSLHNSLAMSKMFKFITDQTTFSVFTNKRLLRDTRARGVYFLSFL